MCSYTLERWNTELLPILWFAILTILSIQITILFYFYLKKWINWFKILRLCCKMHVKKIYLAKMICCCCKFIKVITHFMNWFKIQMLYKINYYNFSLFCWQRCHVFRIFQNFNGFLCYITALQTTLKKLQKNLFTNFCAS